MNLYFARHWFQLSLISLLLGGVIAGLVLAWYNPGQNDISGTVTFINYSAPGFRIDNQPNLNGCSNISLSSLRIGEVIELKQAHLWPFDDSCQLRVIQP